MNRRRFLYTTAAASASMILSGCGGGTDAIGSTLLLASKQDALDQLLKDFMAKTGVPGAAVSLLNTRDSIASVSGVRILGKPEKIALADPFHIGSNAKSMLAMLVMRSVELGELSIETPIYQLLPNLRATGKAAYERVTLENLLSHRAGILQLLDVPSIEEGLPIFEGSDSDQRRQTLAYLTSLDPISAPRASFAYSNGSYACAAAVLEALTGKSYERLIEERLFAPLGINATIGWPAESTPTAPYGHYYFDDVFTPFKPDDPRSAFRPSLSPAGNVSMNIADYAKYLRAQLSALRGEEAIALTRQSYERIHRAIAGTEFGYGLGWATDGKDKQNRNVTYHYGSTDIFGCFALVQPTQNRAVAVIVNGEKPPFDALMSGLAYAILALLD